MTYAFAAVFGLLFGSLAGAAAYRLPRGQTLLRPARSHCPDCGRTLGAADLVPVLSFLLLRGRCRSCGARLSWRYPAAELATAALFCAALWRDGLNAELLPVWGLCFCLVALSLSDIETCTLPDGLVIAAGIFGVFRVALSCLDAGSAEPVAGALLGALAGAAPLLILDFAVRFFAKKDAFGFGDVKLMAACGLFLSPGGSALALLAAVMAGGLFAAALLAAKRLPRGSYMPFGPFLAAGALFALWVGDAAVAWYMGFFAV